MDGHQVQSVLSTHQDQIIIVVSSFIASWKQF